MSIISTREVKKMRQEKKQKDIPAITLVLCFCLMALVSVFVVKASIDKVKSNLQPVKTAEVSKKETVNDHERSADSSDKVIDSRRNSSTSNDKAPDPKFTVPINGEIIMKHSADMPIYWATLDQYMTHSGIDIAAPLDTSVKACSGGTITRIEEDDSLGITMEINHGNDLISVYGNLAKEDLAELGEVVSAGDIIGKVGKSSLFEFDIPDHLHFEMKKNGEPADPGDYIDLNEMS